MRAVHFPGLHGLRFFAALAVVIGHVELLKSYHGLPSYADHLAVYELGRIAVTFFFVLSGFLITYLLLQEKQEVGTISVGKFYLRRVLRIWPLYYFVVFLAFAVIPHIKALQIATTVAPAGEHHTSILILFLALLPQVALSLYPPFPYAEPLWSIGVEEQFYLFWPLIVSRVKNVMPWAISIAIAGIVVKRGAIAYASQLSDRSQLQFWNHFIDYFYFNRFECMTIGAVGAWVLFERKERLLRFLFSRPVQIVTYVCAAYAIGTTRGKPLLQYGLHSILFCIVIMNVAANERSLLKLRAPIFTTLGNISYAMYLLHEIAIGAVLRVIGAKSNVALYATGIVVTMAMAAVAYKVIELPFLRMKGRMKVV